MSPMCLHFHVPPFLPFTTLNGHLIGGSDIFLKRIFLGHPVVGKVVLRSWKIFSKWPCFLQFCSVVYQYFVSNKYAYLLAGVAWAVCGPPVWWLLEKTIFLYICFHFHWSVCVFLSSMLYLFPVFHLQKSYFLSQQNIEMKRIST